MKKWLVFILLVICFQSVYAEVKSMRLEYQSNGITMEGYLAWDDQSTEQRPGILVVHDWMGENEFARNKADELAKLGYVAFAADMYGKGVRPKSTEEAAVQAGKLRGNRSEMRSRINAALTLLKQQKLVVPTKTAAIGFCFGGGVCLELARSGSEVNGVVSLHGNLDTPNSADAKQIKGKVLVLHGAIDPFVNADQVSNFQKEMKDANTDWQLIAYGGAVHSFTNPNAGNDISKGAAYNPIAAKRSWLAMQNFFDELFH